MNEHQIIALALENLQTHAGIVGEFHPTIHQEEGEIVFQFPQNRQRVFVEIKNELKPYQLAAIENRAKQYKPYMVVAHRIYPAAKEELKKKGIGFLDTAGNMYLVHDNIMIRLEGNKQVTTEVRPVTNRAFTKTGLKAVFYFLINEYALNQPYREIAKCTGIALGNIKYIIDGLKEAGYILQKNDKTCLLQNKKALLERWIAGYRETLKPSIHIGNFRFGDNDAARNLLLSNNFIVDGVVPGGELAAEIMTQYLHAQLYTVYTTMPRNELLKKFKLIPDPKGEFQVYQKFWLQQVANENEAHDEIAPPLLVYADLVITDDPRCIETAQMIFDNYLKDEFEKR